VVTAFHAQEESDEEDDDTDGDTENKLNAAYSARQANPDGDRYASQWLDNYLAKKVLWQNDGCSMITKQN